MEEALNLSSERLLDDDDDYDDDDMYREPLQPLCLWSGYGPGYI